MEIDKILQKSIIIAAHPDDEVLWFSSILDKVDEVVLCFLSTTIPNAHRGRKKTLLEYPLKNISCLGLKESETFYDVDWQNPVITQFGIETNKQFISAKRYEENYYKLKQHLESKLIGYHNVFSHNPWGEYGHNEHVQLYRVIKELQDKLKFDLWVSNYCSNKSFKLMLEYVTPTYPELITLKTNKTLAKDIKDLYTKNECWTYYDDCEWFNEESFIRDTSFRNVTVDHGHIFPLNLIKVEPPFEPKIKPNIFKRINSKIYRTICKKFLS